MNEQPAPAGRSTLERQEHPSPHRGRVAGWALWFGLLGAPFAWTLQELVNVALASNACYPHDVPLPSPLWNGLTGLTLGVEVVAIVLCIAAAVVAFATWRRTGSEKPGDAHQLLGSGDGRTRFMAMAGMMTSVLFLIGTALATLNVTSIPACGG